MDCELLPSRNYQRQNQGTSIYRPQLDERPDSGQSRGSGRPFRFITEINRSDSPPDAGSSNGNGEEGTRSAENDHFDDDWYDLSDEDCEPDLHQVCYTGACKMLGVTPTKSFFDSLKSRAIVLKNHVLGYSGARACAIALVRNSDVTKVTFEGNDIGGRGARCFAQVLTENPYITELTLSENALGSLGAQVICEVLYNNGSLLKLDLTGNGFKEVDAVYVRKLLEKNRTLRELNLSHNEFRELGGETIAEGLCQNDTLHSLNLSWNHLRLKGAVAIGTCLEGNVGLRRLNVSWNGFHDDGCKAIGESLSQNRSLTYLDLTCNRVMEFCLPPLVDALDKNDTLQCVRLGNNSLGMDGAMSVISAIDASEVSRVEELDLGMQSVYSTFVDVVEQITEKRPFRAKYGIVLAPAPVYDGQEEKDSNLFDGDNPMTVLMEFMRLQNLRLIDLFSSLDKDGDQLVTHDEIRFRLEETNVPLSTEGITRLIRNLDADSSGTIDFGELFSGQKEHKQNLNKQMAVADNVPWEKTPIGKVSVKMQQVMDKRVIMRRKERLQAEKYQREAEEKKERLRKRKEDMQKPASAVDENGTRQTRSESRTARENS